MHRIAGLLLLLFFAASPAYSQIIEIAGSTTVKVFMDRAVDFWARKHPEVALRVAGGGSGVGAASMIDGRSTIGMMSREPNPEEAAQFSAQGIRVVRIGFDALVAAISDPLFHDWGMHAISHKDLADVYLGRITNWRQIGGPDRHILVIDKEKQRGTREVFMTHLLGDALADAPGATIIVGANSDVITLLLASDQAIGFLPFGAVVHDSRMHALDVTEPGAREVVVDASTIRSGSYPLARSLYILVRKDAPAYVTAFMNFIVSVPGQRILREAGYVFLKD